MFSSKNHSERPKILLLIQGLVHTSYVIHVKVKGPSKPTPSKWKPSNRKKQYLISTNKTINHNS